MLYTRNVLFGTFLVIFDALTPWPVSPFVVTFRLKFHILADKHHILTSPYGAHPLKNALKCDFSSGKVAHVHFFS